MIFTLFLSLHFQLHCSLQQRLLIRGRETVAFTVTRSNDIATSSSVSKLNERLPELPLDLIIWQTTCNDDGAGSQSRSSYSISPGNFEKSKLAEHKRG